MIEKKMLHLEACDLVKNPSMGIDGEFSADSKFVTFDALVLHRFLMNLNAKRLYVVWKQEKEYVYDAKVS